MAFALTKFKAYVTSVKSATRTRAIQRASMTITAANTDTALDVGTNGGTFWTAVKANATYGALATKAYDKMLEIVSQATVLDEIGGTIEAYDRVDGQKYDYVVYDSNASAGGNATETLTVTGLAVGDTVLGVTQKTAGAGTKPSYAKLTSNASSGGAATETMTVTGLVAGDTVLAITEKTPGANGTAIVGWSAPGAGTINVTWTANPGANAVVEVLVARTVSVVPVAIGAVGANSLAVTWEADPGAGAVVKVLARRTATTAGSSYSMTWDSHG